MKSLAAFLTLTLLSGLSQPAMANCGVPTVEQTADQTTETGRAATELASLYYPETLIQAVVERQSRTAFEQGVRQSPQGETLLRSMPDLIDVGYEATMSVVRPCVSLLVPHLQSRAAVLMASNLSVPHMRDITRFYRSEAGVATLAAVARSMRPVVPQRRADGSTAPLTGDDIRASVSTDFLRDLTPQQVVALSAFGMSEHGRAFTALTPQLEEISVSTFNTMSGSMEQEIRAAVETAVINYMRNRQTARPGS